MNMKPTAGEQRSEVILRRILKNINDAVIVTDIQGRLELINSTAEALTGWKNEEAKNRPLKNILRILNTETRQPAERPFMKVLQEGAVFRADKPYVLIARDGTEHPITDSYTPIQDKMGNITGMVIVFRDLTSERYAESELQQSEEKFRAFFDNAPIGKSMTSAAPDGGLLRVNKALCTMLGYTMEEMQSISWISITHPDDIPESREGIRSLLAGERDTWSTEKRYITKDGHIVWALLNTRIHRDEEGKPLYLLSHAQDITERKKADEKIQELYRTLEQRVVERTAQLEAANLELVTEVAERKRTEEELEKHRKQLEVLVDERTSRLTKAMEQLIQETEERRKSESALRQRESELEDMNAALRSLLKQRNEDKTKIEKSILANINEAVLPYIDKLKASLRDERQLSLISEIEVQLKNINSTFIKELTSEYLGLSPREIQVATLIKGGKSTKEVAVLMNVTENAIMFHRNNIREKVGLKNNKVSLMTFLQTLDNK